MDSKRIGLSLAAGLLLPLSVAAAPLSYNNLDLEYYNVEVDGGPVNDEGVAVGGSAEFTPNFFFIGRYADSDDLQRISAGVGAHTPLAPETSLYGVLSFEDVDIDRDARDGSGFGLEGGLRHALVQNFEVNGAVQYLNVDDVGTFDSEFGVKVGALYNFTSSLGVKAGYNIIDDYEEFTVGGRFSF